MRRELVTLAAAFFGAMLPVPASAHHSHPYFYDVCRSVTITGQIARIEFKDPHTLIVLTLDDGSAYTVDWGGLRGLATRGIVGPAKEALVPGVRVEVTGNRIRTAAEIRGYFPDFKSEVNPNTVDPSSIRRVDDSFRWALPPGTTPMVCGQP
jgi:hypothetical protein